MTNGLSFFIEFYCTLVVEQHKLISNQGVNGLKKGISYWASAKGNCKLK